jgi:uncharacterized protein involved in exopolysaccharide biosynthesis
MSNILDELRIALYGIWHRRWLALGVAWVVCLLGWLVVAMVPNTYESKARIFIQIDDVLSDQIGIGGDAKRDIDRVRQTLTSSVNLEKVVRATRLGDKVTTDKQMESAVAGLSTQIKVVSQQDNLFEISATSGRGSYTDAQNAKLAQDIVQKMIDIFREENLAGGRGEMTDTLAFMDQQLADRQKDLEAAEQKRQEFEAKNADLMPGTGSLAGKLEGRVRSCAGWNPIFWPRRARWPRSMASFRARRPRSPFPVRKVARVARWRRPRPIWPRCARAG